MNLTQHQIWSMQKIIKNEGWMASKLSNLKSQLQRITDEITECQQIEYTGTYVLLKIKDNKFEFLGFFNPDTFDEEKDQEPEWDFALPIPKPETYPEFQGW